MKIGIVFKPHAAEYARFGKDAFAKIKEHGFSAIDYSMINTEAGLYLEDGADFERSLLRIRTEAELAGIEISQIHGPWRYPPRDNTPEDRCERMEKMKRSLLASHILGVKYWVVHPIMPMGTDDLATGKSEITRNMNLEFMSELVGYARELGVTVCLENMPMLNFSLATPRKILEFVKEIDDGHFRICLDTGHVNVFPELSAADSVRELGEYIKVLHVHDNMRDKDAHMWPTRGSIDWTELATALREIGFKGVFSLETAPQAGLADAEFEAAGVELCKIARKITGTL